MTERQEQICRLISQEIQTIKRKCENPQQSARLLVSERVDQVYHHHALLRPQGPLDASQLASLLQDLQHSGRFGELVSRYHLRTAGEAVAEHADPMPR